MVPIAGSAAKVFATLTCNIICDYLYKLSTMLIPAIYIPYAKIVSSVVVAMLIFTAKCDLEM